EQMKRLPDLVEARNRWASLYTERLAAEPRIRTPRPPEGCRSNFQSYCVRLREATARERDEIVTRMRVARVQCTPGIQAIHRFTLYRQRYGEQPLPNTELAADTTLILPLFPQMTAEQVEVAARTLIETVRAVLGRDAG
ncbi:MAG: DegT/DnrJ/EryC1/StrS family aminotransferase, partial [Deltaproteobacteria bacterium]